MPPSRACIVRRNQRPLLEAEPDLGGNWKFDSFQFGLDNGPPINQYGAHPKGYHPPHPLFQEGVLADPYRQPMEFWWHARLALG